MTETHAEKAHTCGECDLFRNWSSCQNAPANSKRRFYIIEPDDVACENLVVQAIMPNFTFDITVSSGREAHCWQACSQEYKDCKWSAGLVEGIEPDTLYLRLDSEEEEPLILFLRPDEMLAILSVCAGAMWSQEMLVMDMHDGVGLDHD